MTDDEALNVLVNMRCTEWLSSTKSEAIDCAIVALQQPKIIYCPECKHYYGACMLYGRGDMVSRKGFCYHAEKREND